MKVKAALVLGILALAMAPFASAQNRISGSLVSFEEVPSVSSVATGKFDAKINAEETAIDWELSYADLEGAVQQAHIHFGQAGVNGGITDPGRPACSRTGRSPAGSRGWRRS